MTMFFMLLIGFAIGYYIANDSDPNKVKNKVRAMLKTLDDSLKDVKTKDNNKS